MTDRDPTLDFIELVKDGTARRTPTLRLLVLASYGTEESARYFKNALRGAAAIIGPVFWDIASHGPDDETDDPGTPIALRAEAADWFMHGYDAGLWAVTPEQVALCRALIRVHFGEEPMLEKTKADLAREAGLPTEDMVIKVPVKRKSLSTKQETQRRIAIIAACDELTAALKYPGATPEGKLDAISRYFRVVEQFAPDQLECLRAAVTNAVLRVSKYSGLVGGGRS